MSAAPLELIPAIYFVLDEAGIIQAASQFAAESLCLPLSTLLGSSILDWVHPDHRTSFCDRLLHGWTTDHPVHRWETRLLGANGTDLRVRAVVRGADQPRPVRLHLVFEALSNPAPPPTEPQLQELLRRAIASIAVFRLYDNGQWHYEFFSDGCEIVFGFTATEFMHEPMLWWSRVLPADQSKLLACDQKILQGEPVTYEYRFRHKDGRIRWISSSVTPIRFPGQPFCWVTAVDTDITAHKRAQRALQESESQFRQLTENLADVFWMMNPRTHRVLYISPNYEEMTGLTCEAFYRNARSFLQVVPPEDQPRLIAEWEAKVYSGRGEVIELRILHPQWGVRWLRTRFFPIRNAAGRIYRLTGIAEDVTRQKQAELHRDRAESALYQRELNLLLALEAAQMGTWEYTPATGKHQWSTRTEMIFGFAPGTFPGTSDRFYECVLPADREQVAQAMYESTAHQTPYYQEYRIIRLDGAMRWVSVWGAVYWNTEEQSWKMSGVVKDITERKLVEESLRTQAMQEQAINLMVQQLNAQLEQQIHERTAQLQQALEFGALVKRITNAIRDSLEEGRILQTAVRELAIALNVHSCDTGVYDLEQRTSTIHYEYICSSVDSAVGFKTQMESHAEIYEQLLRGQFVHFCWQWSNQPPVMTRSLHQSYTVLALPLIDDQGVMGDMWLYKPKEQVFSETEIRLVEQVANQCAIALRQARLFHAAQRQVRELERLNQLKDDFLNTVSHELRTPMYTIKLATEMLEFHLRSVSPLTVLPNASPDASSAIAATQTAGLKATPDSLQRYLQIIKDECLKETRLVDDVLDLSRLDAAADPLVLSTLPLQPWLLHVAEPFLDRFHAQQQTFQFSCPSDLPLLTSDFHDLERVFGELLQNACKYTPAHGTISMTVQYLPGQAVAGLENGSSRGCFQILTSNTGVEIPAEERSRIFDKFYRIPNQDPWKYGGTGLGLALVKRRLNRLKGSIEVVSESGRTTFTVQLPESIEMHYDATHP